MRYELVALAIAFAAIVWCTLARDRARIRRARGALFDACRDLFDPCRVVQDAVDIAVLDGCYRGRAFRIEPVIDHVNLRKLPVLWLMVTLREDGSQAGVLDFLVRPQNTEFYSPSAELPVAIAPPPGWPSHAALRTDRPEAMPPVDVVGRHIDFFEDPRAKELLVTPRGLRLVYQANQAKRSHYLVLRQAEFDDLVLDPGLLRNLMDRAIALHDDLVRDAERRGRREAGADAQAA